MLCGENRDRKGLRLPGSQEQFVESLIATGKPVVLGVVLTVLVIVFFLIRINRESKR